MVETQDTGGVLKGTIERFPPSFFLRATPLTEPDADMVALARTLFDETGGEPLDFLHALMTQIHRTMTFDADATSATTSAVEAFGVRRGVCQDFTHIFAACARSVGVPARYVSGHFYSTESGLAQEAGHAWTEAFVPNLGWVGFDAANGICVTDAHIRVAIGLDSEPPPCAARAMAAATRRWRSPSGSTRRDGKASHDRRVLAARAGMLLEFSIQLR